MLAFNLCPCNAGVPCAPWPVGGWLEVEGNGSKTLGMDCFPEFTIFQLRSGDVALLSLVVIPLVSCSSFRAKSLHSQTSRMLFSHQLFAPCLPTSLLQVLAFAQVTQACFRPLLLILMLPLRFSLTPCVNQWMLILKRRVSTYMHSVYYEHNYFYQVPLLEFMCS